jgi:SPX domain protein involved in polyphosphate accumulation
MNDAQRFEFKFIITAQQRDEVLSAFNGAVQPDANGSSTGVYPIVSLYYDSPDRRCYWEAWRGLPSRRKLRVRVYGTNAGDIPPTSFVEVKHKLDGLGVKRRVQTSLAHALEIGSGRGEAGHFAPAEASVVREVHRLVHDDGFRPVCAMRYRRHAFFLALSGSDEPVRITFDDELGARFRDLHPEPDDRRCDISLIPPDLLVMEVKGVGAVPYPVARWLAKSGLSPRSFSKYCAASRLSLSPLA